MTNEELATAIQTGHHEYIPNLWEGCRKIIYRKAARFKALHENCKQEIEDLVQCGYFAMIEAIKYYKPDEDIKFLTYLNKPLLREFLRASGWLTTKRDLIDYAISLDAPIDEDGEATLAEIIPDTEGGENVIDKLLHETAIDTINKALSKLPERKAALIRAIYFEGLTETAAGRALGYKTTTAANNAHHDALRKLRRGAFTYELRYLLYEME